MSPRHASQPDKTKITPPVKKGPSKDRGRHLEDARHHPAEHPLPHPPHKAVKKPVLAPKHTPHSHPHGDELPAHTNPPGLIKPSKKVTKTGSRP
jgi:hypothetical protein